MRTRVESSKCAKVVENSSVYLHALCKHSFDVDESIAQREHMKLVRQAYDLVPLVCHEHKIAQTKVRVLVNTPLFDESFEFALN